MSINTVPTGQGNNQTRPACTLSLLDTFHPEEPTLDNTDPANLSLNRRPTEHELLARAHKIMGNHRYVHFSLQDGRAVHLSKAEDGVIVHVVRPGVLPNEVRYTDISERTFIDPNASTMSTAEIINGVPERTDVILNDLEIFLRERARRPLIVQVSPQGYHENDIHKLKLGLEDTGGQDKYINDSGDALTNLGYTVLNINRAGPSHPENGDVREGMHYSFTGMDLLFVPDALPANHPQFGKFIAKEQMYPSEEWTNNTPPLDPIFYGMARRLVDHLLTEPQRREFTLVGHYADGGTVAWHAARIIEDLIQNSREMQDAGYKTPKVWYNAHSLGILKQRAFEEAGTEYDPKKLRFEDRHRFEQFLYKNVDGIISTSHTMTESMQNDFGRPVDYFLPPGIDVNQFYHRPKNVLRTDSRYDEAWKVLEDLSGQHRDVLNKATLIMEVSRTAETKGKIDVLRAFAASLTEEDVQSNGKFLIINIADPSRARLEDAERKLAETLHAEIKKLGISQWVITKNDFAPTLVAKLHQIADIFFTGAVSEPWGMSLQQAAASKQAVISTTKVPSGTAVLMGDNPTVIKPERSRAAMKIGTGAIFIEPTDHMAGAAAIQHLIDNPTEAQRLAASAHNSVIPHYTWNVMIGNFVMDAFGHELDGAGNVKWPKDKAILDGLTKPRWA